MLRPVEEEIRRVIRNERAKDAAYRSVRSWGHGRPGRGVRPSARPATSPSICGNEATVRSGDEAQTALHVPRGLPATAWCRRQAVTARSLCVCRHSADRGPRGAAPGRTGVQGIPAIALRIRNSAHRARSTRSSARRSRSLGDTRDRSLRAPAGEGQAREAQQRH